MKPVNDIDQKTVKEFLDYDPKTGIFRWKKRDSWPKFMNTRLAGKEAGCKNVAGYVVIRIGKRLYLAHRLAWLIMKGEWPEFEVDHRDGVKSNNKWLNLRNSTHAQNKFNCGLSKRNTSGYKGITWSKHSKKWIAQISVDGRHRYLGLFKNPLEAHNAYEKAAKKYHKNFARMK